MWKDEELLWKVGLKENSVWCGGGQALTQQLAAAWTGETANRTARSPGKWLPRGETPTKLEQGQRSDSSPRSEEDSQSRLAALTPCV